MAHPKEDFMAIDSHAHIVPMDTIAALSNRSRGFPSIDVESVGNSIKFNFAGKTQTRPVMKGLYDVEARLAWMEEQGITHQVNGTWLDMTGYEIPADECKDWSRFLNEALAGLMNQYPELVTLATVPLQSGEDAAIVLREAHEAGFAGAMIGTQPKGKGGVLDDEYLQPFWATASELGSTIVIHPMYDCGDERVNDYGLANGLGRITDTVITVARMLYAGIPGRFSGARIVVPIGGAALPFVMGRLMRSYEIGSEDWANPQDEFKHLWVDTVVHDADTLQFVAKKVGWDKVMLGTDKPFPIGDFEPRKVIEAQNLPEQELEKVLRGNAASLFSIE